MFQHFILDYNMLWAFLAALVLFSVFYLTGAALRSVLKAPKLQFYSLVYLNTVLGLLIWAVAYALYCTKGLSILLPIPILILVFVKKLQLQHVAIAQSTTKKSYQYPILFSLAALFLYFLYYAQAFQDGEGSFTYIYGDQEFYTRVAQNIQQYGIENLRVETIWPQRFSLEPYHYGDIWTIALAMRLFPFNPVVTASLCVAPVLLSIMVMGLLATMQQLYPSALQSPAKLLLLFAAFVGGFVVFFPSFVFPNTVDVFYYATLNYTKLLWWAALFPMLLLCFAQAQIRLMLLPLAIIVLGYITVLPSLLMTVACFFLYEAWKLKKWKSYLIPLSAFVIILVAYLFFWYSFYPKHIAHCSNLSAKAQFSILGFVKGFGTSLNIFIGGALQFLCYLPALVLMGIGYFKYRRLSTWKPIQYVLIFLLLFAINALFIWALLFSITFEAIQFFYNSYVVAMGIFSSMVYLLSIIHLKSPLLKIAVLIICLLAIYPNRNYEINKRAFDQQEFSALKQFVSQEPQARFAHYRDTKDYSNDIFGSSTVVAMPLSILGYIVKDYQNFSLNVPFTPLDTTKKTYTFQKANIEWAPMSYFVQQEASKGLSEEQLMLQFVKTQKINFLCTPLQVQLPQLLKTYCIDSLVLPKEAWKIYRIHY